MAVKACGPNPDSNSRLKMAIQNARGMNMPKDNVDRAIKKAAGGEGVDIAEITYEGYATGGVAIFVDAATNNPTRTVANVRSFFSKCNGTLGTSGSLSHVFERKAQFVVEAAALKGRDGDEFEMECIDAGADDVIRDEEGFIVLTPYTSFGSMQQKLEQLGVELDARGNVKADENYMSSIPGVFAAGDMRRGQSLVVWAIAEGRKAAKGVDAWMMGESNLPG